MIDKSKRVARLSRILASASLAVCFVSGLHAQEPDQAEAPRAMSAQDLVTMPRLGAVTANGDGTAAIYSVTTTDPATYRRSTASYLRPLADIAAPAVELALPEGAHSPAFGPGGTLFFLAPGTPEAPAEPVDQLWRGDLAGDGAIANAVQLSRARFGVTGFVLSPDAARVVLTAELPRECADLRCEDAPEVVQQPGSGRLYDASIGFVRHWDRWREPGVFARAFAYRVGPDALSDPAPLDGAAGMDGAVTGHLPTQPFGGTEDIAWAADGSAAFFVLREAGAGEPLSTDLDIYRSALDGTAPMALTDANEAVDTAPTPSPDGRYLAYLAMSRPGYESDRLVVQLHDLQSGETRALTEGFDRSFGSIAWTPDSRWLVATAQDRLDTPAFRIDPRDGSVQRLSLMAGNEAHIGTVIPIGGEDLLFKRDSIGAPAELFVSRGWDMARPVTDVATSIVGRLAPTVTTRFSFDGAGGDTVMGQITKPAEHRGKLPAVLYIHGGPQGSFNDRWSSRWNPRVLASQGYAVISVDFHGSTGYGQTFTDSINRDWGGKPLTDLQMGLAAALELDPAIDGERACAMGASYGGYMVNWIAGNWPDRFDCLVQHDGLFDMRSFYYSTEELWFPRWDFGGSYAQNPDSYERWNPVNYVRNWRTPMLVIAGEKDFRVPYTQGLQSFTALQEQGVEAQLLVFPDENHWVLGAANSLQWHNTVFDWLARWLKPAASDDGDNGEDGE